MDPSVTLRNSAPKDNEYLYGLFAETRHAELAPLGWSGPQEEVFLRMQFTAQQQSYRAQFPNVTSSIIEFAGEAIGGILVANGGDEIRLVDIALMPAHRGRGIGAQLIQTLIDEGTRTQRPVRLSVALGNRAINLYRRLGFQETGTEAGGVYLSLEKLAV